ncbi:vacuolar protein sorting-associated protein 33A, partial [Etheostoma cragini]|uniref:vacuolar protein sorting-associated protein 33A n=1 Tax=Etheostoma cragini TaxID=417921 RepID=UPI00155F1112
LAGYVKLPPEKFAQKKPGGEASKDLPTEPKKLQLNSAEELYAEIRDKNFNAVGAALSKKAKIISAAFEVGLHSALLLSQMFWLSSPQSPNDISYVYSGYAPLSVRLTQVLARPGWRSIEEVLKMLPGPHFEERQQLPAGLHKKRQQGENRTTLVFFLGGVSYAEIAALRFLSQMEDSGMEYIIATTKLLNGTTWIKSLMDRPELQSS